jgi:hypothetical protein
LQEPIMQSSSARNPSDSAAFNAQRFDGERVRRILQRAVEEQHGIDRQVAETYTLEELEEMAEEAGISSVALHAAIDAERRDSGFNMAPAREAYRAPEAWGVVTAALVAVALAAVLLVLWVAAPTAFWVTALSLILLSLLVLIVGSPF